MNFKTFTCAMLAAVAAAMVLPGPCLAQEHEHQHAQAPAATGSIPGSIPSSIMAEHEKLHEQLARIPGLGGRTGAEAEAVEKALAPHFKKEEEYALPELGALAALSRGEAKPEMRSLVALAGKLKAELPDMLAEHRVVVAALDRLEAAAKAESHAEAVAFAEALRHHARTEEEILYPASILVGEYLRLRLGA